MKKYLIATLAIVMAMTACRRTMYNEEVPPQATSTTDAAETGAPQAITLTSYLTPNIETKSLGALDHWLKGNQELYIYGIPRVIPQGEQVAVATANLDFENILINNVKAKFPTDFTDATITNQKIDVIRTGDEPYYYDESKRYEFFGYYVDDAVANPQPALNNQAAAQATAITLPITINGAQDVMLATAHKEADLEYYHMESVNPDRLYSAYSSRKGIRPNLKFEHMLSRFNVYVKSGDDATVTNKMHITTLSFETKTSGVLYIANKDQENVKPYLDVTGTELSYLGIWNGDNGASTKQLDRTIQDDNKKYTYDPTNGWTKAGTIMVMPGLIPATAGENGYGEYKIKVGIKQDGATAQEEYLSDYAINFADLLNPWEDPKEVDPQEDPTFQKDRSAQPGHQYDVNIVVYGLQEIVITVSMSEWVDGGSFVIDQDSDNEVPITTALDDPQNANYNKGKTAGDPLVLDPQQTFNLQATVPTGSNITEYKSSNTNVVTVSETGTITAVGGGDAYVSIKASPIVGGEHPRPDGGYRVVYVHVTGGAAQNLVVTPATANFDKTVGDPAFSLGAPTVKCGNQTITGATITYEVTAGSSVSVDNAGEVTVLAAGESTITITATKAGYTTGTATVTVTVAAAPAQNPTLVVNAGADVNKTYGDAAFTLAPSATDDQQQEVTGVGYTFAVTAGDAVTVNETTGEVTIVKAGAATITVTGAKAGYDGDTDDVEITVSKATPAAITVTGVANDILERDGLHENDIIDLAAIINRSGDGVITTAIEDGKGAVATLAGNVITVKGNGTAQITVSVAEGTNYQAAADYVFTLSLTNVVNN